MTRGSPGTGFRSDSRGQSAPIGEILVLAIVVVAAVGIVAVGVSVLSDGADRIEEDAVTAETKQLATDIDLVYQGVSTNRSVSLGGETGVTSTAFDAGTVTVTVTPASSSDAVTVLDADVTGVRSDTPSGTVTYATGGVWEHADADGDTRGDVIREPAGIGSTGDTVTVGVVSLDTQTHQRDLHDSTLRHASTDRAFPTPDDEHENPVEEVTVTYQGELFEEFAAVFEEQFAAGTVAVDESAREVTVTVTASGTKTGELFVHASDTRVTVE